MRKGKQRALGVKLGIEEEDAGVAVQEKENVLVGVHIVDV